jgi:uncharacterized protein (DUF305 family)
MSLHHAAGAAMGRYAAEHGEHGEAKKLGAAMARAQLTEITEMNNRRAELGIERVPDAAIDALLEAHPR